MDEPLRLIVFAHERSGSSSLYEILNLHPQLRILEEPFSEGFRQWSPYEPNYRELITDTASLDEQLASIFSRYSGLKVLHYQLPEALYTHMLLKPACSVIFLRRRNLLQTVVSTSLALQTNLWKKWEMTRPLREYYAKLEPLSIPKLKEYLGWMKRDMDYYESVVSSRPAGTCLKLMYEDLYLGTAQQRAAWLERTWHFLRVDPLRDDRVQAYLDPLQAKLNDQEAYAFLPNGGEINRELGDDETGWLF